MPQNPAQNDDDIIELTEIVEQGTVTLSDDDADLLSQPGDDSFEKELEDLFADQPKDADDDALLLEDEVGAPTAGNDDIELESDFSDLDDSSGSDSQDELNASLNKSFGLLDESDEIDLQDQKPEAQKSEEPLDLSEFDDLGLLDEEEKPVEQEDASQRVTEGMDDLDDLDMLLANVEDDSPAEAEEDSDFASLLESTEEAPEGIQEEDELNLELDKLEHAVPTVEKPEIELLTKAATTPESPPVEMETEDLSGALEGAIDELDKIMDDLNISLTETTGEPESVAHREEKFSSAEDVDSLLGDLEIHDGAMDEDAGFDALEHLADEEELPELLEPWNDTTDESILNDLATETPAASAEKEESFPDLDDLIASLDQDRSLDHEELTDKDFQPERLEEIFPEEDTATRVEILESRLNSLEQTVAAGNAKTLSQELNKAMDETLEADSPLTSKLVQLVLNHMEPRLTEIVDARLKAALPVEDVMTKAQWQELSEKLRSELTGEMDHLAAQAAAEVIREELSSLLSEGDDKE